LRTLRTGQSHAAPSLPGANFSISFIMKSLTRTRPQRRARKCRGRSAPARFQRFAVTAERLRVSLSNKLQNKPLFVIANREP